MDDISSYYNVLNDVAQGNLSAQEKLNAEAQEKGEKIRDLMTSLGSPLLDEGLTDGTNLVVKKAFKTAGRIAKGQADKFLENYGLNSEDLEGFIKNASQGKFKNNELRNLYNSQRDKLEGFLKKIKGQNYTPDYRPSAEGNILPSQRIEPQGENINLDGDEEIERMSREDEGAKNLYNYRKNYLQQQRKKLTGEEKDNVKQAVEEAKERGDYVTAGEGEKLDNAEKAKNLKVRRDAINEQLDNREIPLISHTERPTQLSINPDKSISEEPIQLEDQPLKKSVNDILGDNRVVNFDTLQQDIQSGRGASATRIANKNVGLQKAEFLQGATDEQRTAYNNAETRAFNEIDLLGKTPPETAMAKLQAQQNIIHQSLLGKEELNGGEIMDSLKNKTGGLSDSLQEASSNIQDTASKVLGDIGDNVRSQVSQANTVASNLAEKVPNILSKGETEGERVGKALLKGGERMAEIDAEGGGLEDAVGDIISLGVGVGSIIGGLFHKNPTPTHITPLSTSIQLGAGSL